MNSYYIQELLKNFLQKNHKQQLFDEQMVIKVLPQIMDDFFLKNTKNITIKNGVLSIQVINASLRFELMTMKTNLIKKINSEMGVDVVKDILFR